MKTIKMKTILMTLILLVAVLAGCAQNEEEPPVADPTDAPEVVEDPTPEPAPTDAPQVEPTAEAAPTAEPTSAPVGPTLNRLGILRFADTPESPSGAYLLQVQELPPAPAGQHYELWLTNENGALLNLGTLEVQGNSVTHSGTVAENLVANYSMALITLQPDGESSSAVNQVLFTGLVAPEALLHVRHIVVAFPGTPDGEGFLRGGKDEALLAADHAMLAQEALAVNDFTEARRHAEHVINILDGAEGEFFGDLDGDGLAQNPGDGFGLRAYLNGAIEHAELAANAPGATDEVRLHAGHTIIASKNTLLWLDEAIAAAVRILSSDSVAEAQPSADELSQLTADMIAGRDVDGDGAVAPIEGEGAIDIGLQHALLTAGLEIFEGSLTPDALIGGSVGGGAAGDAGHAGGGEGGGEAAPAEVTVEMLDFEFVEKTLTIPAGTTVTWVNVGAVQHSATADDASWDTGLYGAGGQASITFDTPGTYPYYCVLHGTAGGNGMAGTIIVE